jgi:hypothetical protein
MKRLISAALLAAVCAATPALANHDNRNGNFDERAARIEQRMEHARSGGELTPPEYQRLRYELRGARSAITSPTAGSRARSATSSTSAWTGSRGTCATNARMANASPASIITAIPLTGGIRPWHTHP